MTPLLIDAILMFLALMAAARAERGVRGAGEGRDLLDGWSSLSSELESGAAPTMREL